MYVRVLLVGSSGSSPSTSSSLEELDGWVILALEFAIVECEKFSVASVDNSVFANVDVYKNY